MAFLLRGFIVVMLMGKAVYSGFLFGALLMVEIYTVSSLNDLKAGLHASSVAMKKIFFSIGREKT